MVLQRGPDGEFWRASHPDQRAWSNGLPRSGVLHLCKRRQADVVLRRELDDLCSGRTYVTIGRLAVAVLSGEGVLRGGQRVPRVPTMWASWRAGS